MPGTPPRSSWRPDPAVLSAAFLVLLMSSAVTIGADAFWLVALGDMIVDGRGIPVGVPFAEADSGAWINLPVLGEVGFALASRLGPAALPTLQLVVDAAFLLLLTIGARRERAGRRSTAVVLILVSAGMLPALGVVRAQLYSLIPFAVILLLVRGEHHRPSWRIWLVVPLIAVWGNLHGAVLVGAALTGCYLLFSRLRHEALTAVGVGVATLAALFLNPAGWRTPLYYIGVLGNEAASRGTELWARPQLDKPFDVLLVLVAAGLCALALTRRLPLWEYVALAGLLVGTVTAARHGVWLLSFLTAPAALGLRSLGARRQPHAAWQPGRLGSPANLAALGVTAVVAVALVAPRTDSFTTDPKLVAAIRATAGGDSVLATEPLVESLAAEGLRVWMSNPIDAFSRDDQAAYLDFVAGQGASANSALDRVTVVAAPTGSSAARLAQERGFAVVQRLGGVDVLTRP